MKFKWIFIGFVLLGAAGFAALLPFAYSVAREIRRCRSQFPEDLARFERRLREGDLRAVYADSSAALRRSFTEDTFVSYEAVFVPKQPCHLTSVGDYSAFVWEARWVDANDDPVTDLRFQFWWEDGRHKLRRVFGISESTRGYSDPGLGSLREPAD